MKITTKYLRILLENRRPFYIEMHQRTYIYTLARQVGVEIRVTINGPESRVGDQIYPLVRFTTNFN